MSRQPTAGMVLFCSDVASLSAFYEAVAGMAVQHRDAQYAVLTVPGFELTVHAIRGEPPVARDAAGRVPVREDSYTKLCLPVADLAAARVIAAQLGGRVQPPDREWAAPTFIACDGHDPEGNVFQARTPLP